MQIIDVYDAHPDQIGRPIDVFAPAVVRGILKAINVAVQVDNIFIITNVTNAKKVIVRGKLVRLNIPTH